jgi:hypothetical protein
MVQALEERLRQEERVSLELQVAVPPCPPSAA